MTLQNRVLPTGEIVALSGRGLMLGNRGVLHDAQRRIRRQFQVKRWITCVTNFRGRWKPIMAPNTWTQLFFLDEATAYAAGHRPCAECRNADYKRFRQIWERAFGVVRTVDDIDRIMHAERLDGKIKRTWQADIAALPDGAFISIDDHSWIVWGDELAEWTNNGYGKRRLRHVHLTVKVLTPKSIVKLMSTGLRPGVHPTLERSD